MSETDKFKKWFKILFNAFHQEETVIEFSHDSDPPKEFFDLFSPIKSIKSIKCYTTENDHNEQWQTFNNHKNQFDPQKKLEWALQKHGVNDFILTNGKGIFVIVETKRVDAELRELRKKYKKSDVIAQAKHYKQAFIDQKLREPDVIAIVALGITDESSKMIDWAGRYDKDVFMAFNTEYGEGEFPDPENGFFHQSIPQISALTRITALTRMPKYNKHKLALVQELTPLIFLTNISMEFETRI
ncbi:6979_t:CDS:2 [Diversispora eburnea]|uniref:6979_t:CDS:1 n=1 Tax=Diversispora eburnea TaxID=1213867 RepID=A0A9N9FST4_9GLOM|nr:6979_t:CDS:2 [Diversispora eburnea]